MLKMFRKAVPTVAPLNDISNKLPIKWLLVLALLTLSSAENLQHSSITNVSNRASDSPSFSSNWMGSRRWVGPEWWANPLFDWSMKKGSVISQAANDRTLCLLTYEMNSVGKFFKMRVTVTIIGKPGNRKVPESLAAGFRFARRGNNNNFRSAVIETWHSIDAVIDSDGALVLGQRRSTVTLDFSKGPVTLQLSGQRVGKNIKITFLGTQGKQQAAVRESFPVESIRGGISLLTNGPKKGYAASPPISVSFNSFSLTGSLISYFAGRSFGPIMWSQYAISDGILKIQGQLAPLLEKVNVQLLILGRGTAVGRRMVRRMDGFSRTVSFTLPNWNSAKSRSYVLRLRWEGKKYTWKGKIRKEPSNRQKLKIGCFSCDNGYLFPNPTMVAQVEKQNPDVLFFAGDQLYENFGVFGTVYEPKPIAMLDFLFKYYRFGWTWGNLLRDRPSVILPDDHDVFQANLWGHGGRRLPNQQRYNFTWGEGGYLMSGDWVTAVEKIHVGHLPDPAVEMKLPIGIKPYFTNINYGGIGFAILEDRKFKTGPLSLPVSQRADGSDAQLLGQRQERFLERWAKNWTSHSMKVAFSQTIFCAASTHTGFQLKRGRFYQDKGAWPKKARNRVVRLLGDANVFSIHGDQHLGILLQHGVDKFKDAGYAFMVPGTANGWPRAWWPGVKKGFPTGNSDFTGKFLDDAGHPLDILAVGNPDPRSIRLMPSTDGSNHVGYAKGSGYGIVVFDKQKKTALVNLYRLGNKGEQFDGFPKSIRIGGKPGK